MPGDCLNNCISGLAKLPRVSYYVPGLTAITGGNSGQCCWFIVQPVDQIRCLLVTARRNSVICVFKTFKELVFVVFILAWGLEASEIPGCIHSLQNRQYGWLFLRRNPEVNRYTCDYVFRRKRKRHRHIRTLCPRSSPTYKLSNTHIVNTQVVWTITNKQLMRINNRCSLIV